jgi:superfamily II DNA helicase RecQ
MKVKHFYIRLNKEHLQNDEDQMNAFMESVVVKKSATQFVSANNVNFWSILVYFTEIPLEVEQPTDENEPLDIKAVNKQPPFNPETLNEIERERYENLKVWRADAAFKEGVPVYVIAHNSQLGAIARLNPNHPDDLLQLKGFNERKVHRYGDDIIAVLNSF